MVTIDWEEVNKNSPYEVEGKKGELCCRFKTKFGIEYFVIFEPTDFFSFEAYQFEIANISHIKSPRDPFLRDTVLAIVGSFFQSSKNVMIYLCETGDNKQSMRERLFRYWYERAPHKTGFSILSTHVVDEEGIDNYAAIILRIDNPNIDKILWEFTQTVKMLQEKP